MSFVSKQQLIRAIRIGIRSRLLICLLTIATGYSLYVTHNPYLHGSSGVVFLLASESMIILWGSSFANSFLDSFAWRKAISWDEVPIFAKFSDVAREQGVKLNSNRPFGVRKDYDNAYAILLTKQVIIGDLLLQRLSDQELLALLGHELTHIKQNHMVRTVLWTMFVPALVVLPLCFTVAPSMVRELVYCAAFFITFLFVSWHNEYSADAGAAAIAGPDATSYLLQHVVPKEHWRRESETHPSVVNRVLKLKRQT